MEQESNPLPLEPADPTPAPPRARRIELIEAEASLPDPASDDIACVGCGYNLHGLQRTGRCPECGMDVMRSLHGDQLVYSSAAYLDALCRGIKVIFAALLVRIFLTIAGIVGGVALISSTGNPSNPAMTAFVGAVTLIDIALAVALILGWWWFSTPDPSIVSANKGEVARRFVRVTIVITGAAGVLSSLADAAGMSIAPGMSPLFMALGVIAILAWATCFFASMIYIRWIARRIPSDRVDERARLLMWLGPVLMTVGALCVGLGPLVAFILYIVLIYWIKQDIVAVQEEQARRFPSAPG